MERTSRVASENEREGEEREEEEEVAQVEQSFEADSES